MGVDVRVNIPHTARIEDIANAWGIAAGLSYERLGYLCVVGLRWTTNQIGPLKPLMTIDFMAQGGATLVDGEQMHHVMYHGVGTDGFHHFQPPSNAFWIATATKLVDFFGGTLDYNDCDVIDVNYRKRSRPARGDNDPQWSAYEAKMLSVVTPVTSEELAAADEVASYKLAER